MFAHVEVLLLHMHNIAQLYDNRFTTIVVKRPLIFLHSGYFPDFGDILSVLDSFVFVLAFMVY